MFIYLSMLSVFSTPSHPPILYKKFFRNCDLSSSFLYPIFDSENYWSNVVKKINKCLGKKKKGKEGCKRTQNALTRKILTDLSKLKLGNSIHLKIQLREHHRNTKETKSFSCFSILVEIHVALRFVQQLSFNPAKTFN